MTEETLYERERARSHTDIAATFRTLADQLESSGTLTFEGDDRTVTVHPAERPTFEIEVERERAGEMDELSVELELEWLEAPERETADASGDASTTGTADSEHGTDSEPTVEMESPAEQTESLGRFEVFRDRADEWRWRLVHRNGNIIAASGEGYTTKQNALKGLRSVKRNAPEATIVSKWETTE